MFGLPLHPLIVHFPIVLVALLPVVIGVALWAIRRGAAPRRAWLVPLAVSVALTLSAFVGVRTGSAEEERVERVVPEHVLESHEEAAERFLVLSGALAVVALAGLARGTFGQAARLLTLGGAVGLVAAGVQVGHSGGKLVYQEGAASAYTGAAAGARPATAGRATSSAAEGDEGR